MKSLIIIVLLIFTYYFSFGQCNCQKMVKDGTTAVQCNPDIVSSDNTTAIGLSAGKAGNNPYINLTVRFKNSAKKINSKLTIWLADGNSLDLEFINGGLAYIGNSEVAQGIFNINENQLKKLSQSNIKTISFTLSDGLKRTYQAKSNSNIIVKHLNCLR